MEAECIMAGEDHDLNKITEDLKSLWVEKYAPKKYTELLSEEVSAFLLFFFNYFFSAMKSSLPIQMMHRTKNIFVREQKCAYR